jgi:tetratricopeptide (TPR) repeat protein
MSKSKSKIESRPVAATSVFGGRGILYIGLLAIATVAAYFPLFSNSFVDYDDPAYITGNSHVRSGLTLGTLQWAWTSIENGNWHPLTWISHALDVELFGLDPAGHHFTSLLLHIFNKALFYFLLTRITRERGKCLAVAALYAVHPLGVESVAWAAERKNLLCTLFFFLAIAAYGWYAKHPSVLRYLWVALAFALGLCAKPMVITLPFVLLLLDFWPLGRVEGLSTPAAVFPVRQFSLNALILEKTPLLILSAASAVITVIAQSSAGALATTAALPPAVRIGNAIYSYFDYVFEAFWPARLAPFYPAFTLSRWQVMLALAFLVAVSAAVWWQRMKRPYLIVGWLFYLGTLVPVIGLIQVGVQGKADRYTYIPLIGIFVAVVWLASDLAANYRWRPVVRVLAPAAIMLVLAARTWRQVRFWHDDISLWSYSLEMTADNAVAEDNLGIALLKDGRTEEALPHFYRASRLNPNDPISGANVATDLLAHGQTREAIAKYEIALTRASFIPMLLPNIHSNLGSAYLSLGDRDQARDHYKAALDLNPEDQVARSGLSKLEATPTNSSPMTEPPLK